MTLLNLFKNAKSDYVFTHTDGTLLRVLHIYRYFCKAQQKAEMETIIRFHDLRHTFASNFMMNGGNIYELQKILGHSKIEMTMIYAHLSPEHLRNATSIISFGEIDEKEVISTNIAQSLNEHSESNLVMLAN